MSNIFDIPPNPPSYNSEQVQVFKEIWDERVDEDGKRRSEISGHILPYNFQPSMFFVFCHIHSKGSCPNDDLKLNKENIVLTTLREHQDWENYRHKLEDDSRWEAVFQKFEDLKHLCK